MGDHNRRMINLLRVLDRCKLMSTSMDNLHDGQLLRLEKLLGFTKSELREIESDNNSSPSCVPESTVDELTATISAIACELQHHLKIRQQQRKAAMETDANAFRQRKAAVEPYTPPQPSSPSVVKTSTRLAKRTAQSARQELLDNESDVGNGAEDVDHDSIQNSLTKDMVDMAGNLKEIMKQTGETLKTDKQLIQDASAKADVNIKKQDEANAQLSSQIQRSGGCWLWMLLLGIACNFLGMVVFIRLT